MSMPYYNTYQLSKHISRSTHIFFLVSSVRVCYYNHFFFYHVTCVFTDKLPFLTTRSTAGFSHRSLRDIIIIVEAASVKYVLRTVEKTESYCSAVHRIESIVCWLQVLLVTRKMRFLVIKMVLYRIFFCLRNREQVERKNMVMRYQGTAL